MTTIEVSEDDLDRQLIARLPSIDWWTPVTVVQGELVRYGCRLCIAKRGLRGEHVKLLATVKQEVQLHIVTDHPVLRPGVKA